MEIICCARIGHVHIVHVDAIVEHLMLFAVDSTNAISSQIRRLKPCREATRALVIDDVEARKRKLDRG